MKELLKKIIFEQQEYCKNIAQDTIPRAIEDEWLTTTEILIITGIRRCGKSVLLQQMRRKLPEQDFFFNFDDERLVNFTVEDFQTLQECFFELFGEQHTYYFDEIQNVKGWETFVRRLYNEGNKVIVTGSNAKNVESRIGHTSHGALYSCRDISILLSRIFTVGQGSVGSQGLLSDQ